jgi:hypothetical protein
MSFLEKRMDKIVGYVENNHAKQNTMLKLEYYSKPLLIRMSDNPDRNMKNEKCCSQLSTYFKRHLTFRKALKSLVCSDKI